MGLPAVPRSTWKRRLPLLAAAGWGLALIVGACLVPVYSATSVSASSPPGVGSTSDVPPPVLAVHSTATLVQENGWRVLGPVGAPLLVVGAVALVLRRRESRGGSGAGVAAWTLTVLLLLFCLVGLLSIGILILPIAALLVVACAAARGQPQR